MWIPFHHMAQNTQAQTADYSFRVTPFQLILTVLGQLCTVVMHFTPVCAFSPQTYLQFVFIFWKLAFGREAGDVWCLTPVWNPSAVIWSPFPISLLGSLLLLLFLSCHFSANGPFAWLFSRKLSNSFRQGLGFFVWLLWSSWEMIVGRWYVQLAAIWHWLVMSWCLMSSDVIWHIRDKLWPMPKHGSIKSTYVRCMRV